MANPFTGRPPTIVLASASPRRQELLRNAGIAFTVHPAHVDETPHDGEAAQACAERLAREKALVVFRAHPQAYVLGADTVVIVDDEIFGKPRDEVGAVRMLQLLAGRIHRVITGVCLVGPNKSATGDFRPALATENRELSTGFQDTRSETTLVTVSELSDQEIRDYVATGEPMDKAGAYAIQGMASRWILRIKGDYCNVVGLPVALVYRMLREHAVM
jgi:septum formation protein